MKSDDDMLSDSGVDHCGEFYPEPNEWKHLCRSDESRNIISLDKNWTNILAEKFAQVNYMCVLKV